MTATCPSCGAAAAGKFCASCGAPLAGASCANCHASLTPGAKFCHRCGTVTGMGAGRVPLGRDGSNALPWAVAGIALLALVALVAGQRFARSNGAEPVAQPLGQAMPAGPRAPDISQLSPAERAERLYDRIMGAAERGRVDTVRIFMPMALQAYQALGELNADQRYDLGRLAEVAGDATLAAAQADTILRSQPNHLLGLLLASKAAGLRNDARAARQYLQRLVGAEPAERAKQLPEYLLHQADIDQALAQAKR